MLFSFLGDIRRKIIPLNSSQFEVKTSSKMSARIFLVFLLISIAFTNAEKVKLTRQDSAENVKQCLIDGKQLYWVVPEFRAEIIDDNIGAKIIHTYTTSGIAEFKVLNESKWLSFDYNKDKKTLTVSTTPDFGKYEEEVHGVWIEAVWSVKCDDGQEEEITYQQQINDINTYAPTWNSEVLVFEMYGSIPRNFELSNLIQLTVTDKDCTSDSTYLSLEIEKDGKDTEDFTLRKIVSKEKVTFIELTAQKDFHPGFEQTYTLRAKDNPRNGDSMESTAKITIKLLQSEVEFKFTEDEYTASVEQGKLLVSKDILLTEGFDHSIKITIEESEYSEYFSVALDHISGVVRLTLQKPLPAPPAKAFAAKTSFSLTLKATWYDRDITTKVNVKTDNELALICFIPGMDLDAPYFQNPNNLEDTKEGVFFTISNIKNVDNMSCDNAYLDCRFDENNGEFTISTKESFKTYEDSETEQVIKTNLTIGCPYQRKTIQFWQPIKDTNNHAPEFTESKYVFTFYNEIPEHFELTMLHDIIAKEKDLTADACSFEIKDTDTFKISSGGLLDKECKAKVTTTKTLQAGYDEEFMLVVDDGDDRQSQTTFRVKVGKDEENLPEFTHGEYFLKFNQNATKPVLMNAFDGWDIPSLENGMDSKTSFQIVDSSMAGKFRLNTNTLSGKLEVEVTNPQLELCESCDTLSFKIKAMWKGLEAETKLTVVLSDDFVPPTSPPTSPSTTTEHTPTSSDTTPGVTADYPYDGQGEELHGFGTFILSSMIGIILMFATMAVALSAMLYIIVRRFCFKKTESDVDSLAGPLPEKINIE